VRHENTFDDMTGFMEEFGQHFGSFQTSECLRIKEQLMDLETGGTGRVPLSKFYGAASSQYHFTETLEYLRHSHVVDESDPSRTMVIIPNYINSKSNCMKVSAFYSICCPDECERLTAQVEQEIKAPSASSARIAEVASMLESDTVHAPRNLSSTLLARLDDMAKTHGGSVPLHGRLFAQWMHHAFPRECPFPQVADHEAMLPEDWRDAMRVSSVEISDVERRTWRKEASEVSAADDLQVPTLPWIHEEDLIAGRNHFPRTQRSSGLFGALRVVAAVTGMAAFAVKMLKISPKVVGGRAESKVDRYLI